MLTRRRSTASCRFLYGGAKEPCHPACVICKAESEQEKDFKIGRAARISSALKGSKTPGSDDIVAEAITYIATYHPEEYDAYDPLAHSSTRDLVVDIITSLFNKCLDAGEVPSDLVRAKMVALLKPAKPPGVADAKEFNCYRFLTLRNLIDKVIQILITRRVSHYLDLYGLMPQEQAGFRNYLSTISPLFISMHTTRRLATPENPIYNLYADLMKAYDKVDIPAVLYILTKMKVPANMVSLIWGGGAFSGRQSRH